MLQTPLPLDSQNGSSPVLGTLDHVFSLPKGGTDTTIYDLAFGDKWLDSIDPAPLQSCTNEDMVSVLPEVDYSVLEHSGDNGNESQTSAAEVSQESPKQVETTSIELPTSSSDANTPSLGILNEVSMRPWAGFGRESLT